MLTANHKFTNVSNGNQVYVSDLAAMAQNAVNLFSALPLRAFDEPVIMGDFQIGYEAGGAPRLYSSDGQGAVFLYNKIFGLNSGGMDVSIPKGTYLYGLAVANTTQPRVSSTGINYSQFIDYSLQSTTTPRTDVTSDITAQTGVFELINGAATAAMTDGQYISALKNLLTVWNTTDNIQYDYVVDNTETLTGLSNNSNATNVLVLAGNYSITSPIILNPATKRITAQAGAVVTATFAQQPSSVFMYAQRPQTEDYSISNLTIRTNGLAFENCINLTNCVASKTATTTQSYALYYNCSKLYKCGGYSTSVTINGLFQNCVDLQSCTADQPNVNPTITNVGPIGFKSCNKLWACYSNISLGNQTSAFTINNYTLCKFVNACQATYTGGVLVFLIGFNGCTYVNNCITTGTTTSSAITVGAFDGCHLMFGNNSQGGVYNECYMELENLTTPVGPTATGGYNF